MKKKTKAPKAKETKQAGQQDEIPPELVNFIEQIKGQLPADIIKRALPNADTKSLVALTAGIMPDSAADLPAWAKQASQLALASLGMDFLKDFDSKTLHIVGKTVALGRAIPKEQIEMMGIDFEGLFSFAEQEALKSEPEKLKQFAEGKIAAKRDEAKCEQPNQRTYAYMMIAARWFEVEKLKSTTQVFDWLLSFNTDKEQNFSPDTDTREIRAICKSIGLKFNNRGGRPRKKSAAKAQV